MLHLRDQNVTVYEVNFCVLLFFILVSYLLVLRLKDKIKDYVESEQ